MSTLLMRVTGPNSKDLINKSSTGIQVVIGLDMDSQGMFFATMKLPKTQPNMQSPQGIRPLIAMKP